MSAVAGRVPHQTDTTHVKCLRMFRLKKKEKEKVTWFRFGSWTSNSQLSNRLKRSSRCFQRFVPKPCGMDVIRNCWLGGENLVGQYGDAVTSCPLSIYSSSVRNPLQSASAVSSWHHSSSFLRRHVNGLVGHSLLLLAALPTLLLRQAFSSVPARVHAPTVAVGLCSCLRCPRFIPRPFGARQRRG